MAARDGWVGWDDATRARNLQHVVKQQPQSAPYLHYDRYLAAGYPIATGVVEGPIQVYGSL